MPATKNQRLSNFIIATHYRRKGAFYNKRYPPLTGETSFLSVFYVLNLSIFTIWKKHLKTPFLVKKLWFNMT